MPRDWASRELRLVPISSSTRDVIPHKASGEISAALFEAVLDHASDSVCIAGISLEALTGRSENSQLYPALESELNTSV